MPEIDVQITISWHPLRRYVKLPQNLKIDAGSTIVDLIYLIDKQYFENRKNSTRSHALDFMDRKIKSALQMLWNSETGKFYGDVGIECRLTTDSSKSAPIEENWQTPIPNNSYTILIPDAQC